VDEAHLSSPADRVDPWGELALLKHRITSNPLIVVYIDWKPSVGRIKRSSLL
jgi:hypothetical protein